MLIGGKRPIARASKAKQREMEVGGGVERVLYNHFSVGELIAITIVTLADSAHNMIPRTR